MVIRLSILFEDYFFLPEVTDLIIRTKKIDAHMAPTIAAAIAWPWSIEL